MEQAPDNPATNQLGAGVTEEQVRAAVEKSGYPLQTTVGDLLRSMQVGENEPFSVHEEWSFLDRDTGDLRTIALCAELQLHKPDFTKRRLPLLTFLQRRVRPHLSLLIECKQSQLPYVFFLTQDTPLLFGFPNLAGLPKERLSITTDEGGSSSMSVASALDLHRDPFNTHPRCCHTLSKCVRKGSDLELSGSEAYHGLVMPLLKAVDHFLQAETPPERTWWFDCRLTLGVAVLDAPMIGITREATGPTLLALPWVRVLRHEYTEKERRRGKQRLSVLEVVHREYLASYLEDQLAAFRTPLLGTSVAPSERACHGPCGLRSADGYR